MNKISLIFLLCGVFFCGVVVGLDVVSPIVINQQAVVYEPETISAPGPDYVTPVDEYPIQILS